HTSVTCTTLWRVPSLDSAASPRHDRTDSDPTQTREQTPVRHNDQRHSIHCILPPHILSHIAANAATREQRELALLTLDLDHSLRTSRVTFTVAGGLQIQHDAAGKTPPGERTNHAPRDARTPPAA